MIYSRRYLRGGLNLPDCSQWGDWYILVLSSFISFFILIKRELCSLLSLERTKLDRDIRLNTEENLSCLFRGVHMYQQTLQPRKAGRAEVLLVL